MYIKKNGLAFLCAVLIHVTVANGECENYLQCLSNFVQNYLKNTTKSDIKTYELKVAPLSSDADDKRKNILFDISSYLKDEIAKKFNGTTVYDAFKDDNKTQIYIKAFDIAPTDIPFVKVNGKNSLELQTELIFNKNEGGLIDKSTESSENIKENVIMNLDTFDVYDEDVIDENITDYPIIDYIEIYKDTTNEIVEYKPTALPEVNLSAEIEMKSKDIQNIIDYTLQAVEKHSYTDKNKGNTESTESNCRKNNKTRDITEDVFPWIAAIFIKNDTTNQYDYFCDGALLNNQIILTAARCVVSSNVTVPADNLLIITGKRSLSQMGSNEKVYKIKEVRVHDNFTNVEGKVKNDLAILVMAEAVPFTKGIEAACLVENEDAVEEAATTGWRVSGDLTAIYFNTDKTKPCLNDDKAGNTFCATYGNDVAVCPSYGGIYAARQANKPWRLQGILSGETSERGICINKTVMYTSLTNFLVWINKNLA